jgi:Protein of unknown function
MLHIVFGDSAAALLCQALRKAARRERVLRFEWMQRHLGASPREWDWLPEATNKFWSVALSATEPLTVWTSRRTTLEYSGLLEWVWRHEDRAYNVVDLTDLVIERRRPDGTLEQGRLVSLGHLNPDHVPVQPILDRAAPLPASTREDYRQMWKQLRTENAPLRMVHSDRLQSAPITAFDELLLSCAEESWLKVLRVMGNAGLKYWDGDTIQVGDVALNLCLAVGSRRWSSSVTSTAVET